MDTAKIQVTFMYASVREYTDKVTGELKKFRSALFQLSSGVTFSLPIQEADYATYADIVKQKGYLEFRITAYQDKPAVRFVSFK